MKSKNRLILVLIALGISLFIVVEFFIVPYRNKQKENYIKAQSEATTQDLKTIIKYKNKYMGNASNIVNLFNNLPLAGANKKFKLYTDKLILQVNYKLAIEQKGIKKALIYNSVAAFSLIDNLQRIEYNLKENSFTVDRKTVEQFYGNLENLLNENSWKNQVQKELQKKDYVNENFNKLFKAEKKN